MKNALALLALASCLPIAARAAPEAAVPASLLACAKLQDPGKRVRCYDAQVAALSRARAAAAGPVTAPEAGAPAHSSPATSVVGRSAAAAASVGSAPESAAVPAAAASGARTADSDAAPPARLAPTARSAPASAEAPSAAATFGAELLPPKEQPRGLFAEPVLVSRITAVQNPDANVYFISLANGQIWRESNIQLSHFIRVGDAVHIERHALDSYHLWTTTLGAKNWLYVTRIR